MSMSKVQAELKAPKSQYNNFGKYNYRSCEDIVEAAKPVLAKYKYHLVMSDDVVSAGDRVYIKATCKVMHEDKVIAESSALAREAQNKKGMDDAQLSGATSSYARKYALNGLFAIDDTKDADTDAYKQQEGNVKPIGVMISEINKCETLDQLKSTYFAYKKDVNDDASLEKQLTNAKDAMKLKLQEAA